jgi:hypothetical protein
LHQLEETNKEIIGQDLRLTTALEAPVSQRIQDQRKGQTTGSTGSKTCGSTGTFGRAGREQDENAMVADTSPGDVRTDGQGGEDALGGPGTQRTAAERGSAGLGNVYGMQGQTGTQMEQQYGQQGSRGETQGGVAAMTGCPSARAERERPAS